jgi:integral membrane sensor domain MASE1
MFKRLQNSLSPGNLAILASVALLYCLAGKLGLRVAFVHPYITPIWISSGIAVAAFILFGYRVWPAILIGGFLDHLTTDGLVLATFTIPAMATLEGLAAAYLVNKFARGAKAFDTARGVLLFVFFACICAPLISATFGAGMEHFRGSIIGTGLGPRWLTWWLAYGVGTLLVAPFLILLFRAPHHRLDLPAFGELAVLLLGLAFVCLLVFGPLSVSLNAQREVRSWLCFPFLIWAACRFSPLEAAGTTLILFGSAIWGTLHGYGSYMGVRNPAISLIRLDSFIGFVGTMTLVIAAMVAEQRRMERQLLGTQDLLQQALEKKDQEIVVTLQALETEASGHARTKRALRENQERFRRIAPDTELGE